MCEDTAPQFQSKIYYEIPQEQAHHSEIRSIHTKKLATYRKSNGVHERQGFVSNRDINHYTFLIKNQLGTV